MNGAPVAIDSPYAGRRLGIGMVFQNFTLVPAMTVAENIALFLPDLGLRLQDRGDRRPHRARSAARYGLEIDPNAYVADLEMGERQKVEIVKILLGGARVLIFDEPTSVLAPHEVDGLFQVFAKLQAGRLRHPLHHPQAARGDGRGGPHYRAAPRARGRRAAARRGDRAGDRAPHARRRAAQTGPSGPARPTKWANPCSTSATVTVLDPHTGVGLKEVDLKVYAGEIVGIAGVSGNGQSELANVALGLRRIDGGAFCLFGARCHPLVHLCHPGGRVWPASRKTRCAWAPSPA